MRRYRAVDAPLMDDVQIVAGLGGLREELFHTMSELFHSGIQLVLTCDVHPRSIPTLTDRLRNRFASGLLVELQIPDIQTRLGILRRKAAIDRVVVPDDVLHPRRRAPGQHPGAGRSPPGFVALHRLMGAPLIPAVGEEVLWDILPPTRPAGS